MRLKRYFKFHSIRISIIAAFSLLLFCVVTLVCVFAYLFTLNNDSQMSVDYSRQIVDKVNSNIDEYIGQMQTVSNSLANSAEISRVCSQNTGGQKSTKASDGEAADKMATIANTRSDIINIAVLTGNGHAVFSNSADRLNAYADFKTMPFYTQAISQPERTVISPSHVQNLIYNHYKWVISISKALRTNRSKDASGVLLIDLNYNSISNICQDVKLGKNGYIFIVDFSGNIIFHPQQQLVYSNIKKEYVSEALRVKNGTLTVGSGNESRFYVVSSSKVTGWTTIGVIYTDEIIYNKKTIILFYFMIMLVAIIFAIACSFFISTAITRPLKLLEQDMGEVEKGNFKTRSVINNNNEIGQLSKAFNVMVLKIDELLKQSIRDQEQKRRSELKALLAQIKPHFLYNTLDTIVWLAESGNNKSVVKVTSALATLFRTSISKEEETTTLATEIANVKSYLTIQQMRYSDMISFHIDVPEGICGYRVVKLMLQPIVENAIYHGIKPKNGPGTITITGRVENGKLYIDVSDDGVGMTEEIMAGLLESERPAQSSTGGIGVRNVNERIRLYFGNDYGLKFTSAPGAGTTVHFCIPAVKELEARHV